MSFVLYTDGSATMKKVKGQYTRCAGGHAFVVYSNGVRIYEESAGAEVSTNNEQELLAIRDALLWLEKNPEFDRNAEATIYSDSAYCVNIFNKWVYSWEKNGWQKKSKGEIENLEIIKEIKKLLDTMNVKIEKVKGHGNCAGNIRADELAVEAKRRYE